MNDGTVLDYASGLFLIKYKGLKVVGHNGTSGSEAGYRSQFIRFPEQQFSIVLFANRSDVAPWAMTGRIADLFLKDQFVLTDESGEPEREFVTLSSKELEAFVGNYWNQRTSSATEIYVKGDTLWYKNEYVGEYALIPVTATEFCKVNRSDAKITFGMNAHGSKQMLEVIDEKRIDISDYYTPRTYSANELSRFSGNYYSKELETTYQLKMKGDHLYLFIQGKERNRLDPKQATVFDTGDNGVLYFKENKKGKITGFQLAYFSVRISFEKLRN